jgi:hypothetical protein
MNEPAKQCCEECFIPEHDYDYALPNGHSVASVMPEGCKDDYCLCHTRN